MLERIAEVKGVGLFHEANGKPHLFRKATLIYGHNGRGKSTLATIFHSLSSGDSSLILNRKTVDGSLPPSIKLQFGSGHPINFLNGAWSERRSEVLVFDADFIEKNVHSGGSVNTNHRKNLLEFALGESAVTARLAAEKATIDAKSAAEKVQRLTAQLAGYHPGMALHQFVRLQTIDNADAQIKELIVRIRAAENLNAVLSKPLPVKVVEPIFNLDDVFSVLQTSLKNVHADAEKVVKHHLNKLKNKSAERWLSQGQEFGDGSNCPYCDQNIEGSDLIKAYQTHFNAAYGDLKNKVMALGDAVSTETSDNRIDAIAKLVDMAAARASAWGEQVKIETFDFDLEPSLKAMKELREFLFQMVIQKQGAPAEALGSTSDISRAKILWDDVFKPLSALNAKIQRAIDDINAYKGALTAENTSELEKKILLLQSASRRHQHPVPDLIADLADAQANAKSSDAIKKKAREELDELMKETLGKYETSINGLLTKFGASFHIQGMGANFLGGSARSEYGLLLRGKTVALEGGPPSFATALSEGDKRTLAFAFFVASTLADQNLSTKIVVIDDPMCSLDANRKQHTKTVLKKLHENAAQLVVLAHDPYFLRDLRDTLLKADASAQISQLQLTPAPQSYTTFGSLDIDKECESAYFQHHRMLNEFCNGAVVDERAVAKSVRPMLEGYLHRRFPGLVNKSLLFGQVVISIRDSVSPSPLIHAKNIVVELNEINDYAGQFHHDTNPGADTVVVNSPELKIFVQRALHVVHCGEALVS